VSDAQKYGKKQISPKQLTELSTAFVDKSTTNPVREQILRVAVDVPLRKLFDYLPPDGRQSVPPGSRVRVRFGRKNTVGLVVATADDSDLPLSKLKRVEAVLDDKPLLGERILELLAWAAKYYVHPHGEVCAAALPALLRQGRALQEDRKAYRLTSQGRRVDREDLERRAPRQAELVAVLGDDAVDESDERLVTLGKGWKATLRRIVDKGLAEPVTLHVRDKSIPLEPFAVGPELTTYQRTAVDHIVAGIGRFETSMLFGVTGSGKTEVYLRVIERVIENGMQALVIVPEISLTPQLVRRFSERFKRPIAVLHSGLSATARLASWRDARSGTADVVIGTRSAVFTPLLNCGVVVVDEEHDPSLKQQEGFRYSARDLAVMRGRLESVPVVLGSATPSLETLQNAQRQRYDSLFLPERPGQASHPHMRVVDLRVMPARNGLTATILQAIDKHLAAGGQVILFLNRRGYAPTLMCTACGWVSECPRCDARMTLHQHPVRLRCHHCGREDGPPEACPDCASGLIPSGQGTERVEETLLRQFPQAQIDRIDRDTTRNKGALDKILADMRERRTQILIGTQMLTKGHDFPHVSLVGVLNADQGLFGTDFRSDERLAQNILQVSGRAGRSERGGEVLIQTAFPDHPLLARLIEGGYEQFSEAAMSERQAAMWPPFSHLALIRAEAPDQSRPGEFLDKCRQAAEKLLPPSVVVLGPAPSPMERLSGRYRAQLLIRSSHRAQLHDSLTRLVGVIERLPEARRVRWSVDVDPVELF
jgi:primosomal protein N' (replication factor Y)